MMAKAIGPQKTLRVSGIMASTVAAAGEHQRTRPVHGRFHHGGPRVGSWQSRRSNLIWCVHGARQKWRSVGGTIGQLRAKRY